VLAETGIIGFLAFIYLLYSIFKLTFTNLNKLKAPYLHGLTIGFLAGFTGLLFHAIGANTFIIVRIMEPFWFLAGIITVLPQLEKAEVSNPELPRQARFY
jgi:O-antigen ligase